MSKAPRVLIVDSYYPKMLELISKSYENQSFNEWQQVYDKMMFGTGFSYNYFFRKNMIDSGLVVANHLNFFETSPSILNKYNWKNSYYYSRIFGNSSTLLNISPLHKNLLTFIRSFEPDILFIQDINLFPPIFTSKIRSLGIKILGEIASPLPPNSFLFGFDHIISSLPNLVEYISKLGVSSSFHQLGFDNRVNERLSPCQKDIDVLFVGSFTSQHTRSISLLRELSVNFNSFHVYGDISSSYLKRFGLNENYYGQVWGKDMFQVIKRSKIVINRHSSISQSYANNMRMFETTGVGSLLMTDFKMNNKYYFPKDNSIEVYESVEDCITKCKFLLKNENVIDQISQSGQIQTLNFHSYEKLTLKLIDVLKSLI